MKKMLLMGSTVLELVAEVKELPKGNEESEAKLTDERVSGTVFDTVRIFKAFGFDHEVISPIGMGLYGEKVKEAYLKDGIVNECLSEYVNGCVYAMVDPDGNEAKMVVPGAEYEFDPVFVQEIDPDEIQGVVLFGELLCGTGGEDVVRFLDELNKPVLFIPTDRIGDIDDDILEAIYALKPTVIVDEYQADYLAGEKLNDLKGTAEILYEMSEAPVIIYQEGTGLYCCAEETYLAEAKRALPLNIVSAAFACAMYTGIDLRSALMYTRDFAEECRRSFPSERHLKDQKYKLAEMIRNG